jgi:acyl-CoA reductase-like NAD-dependent aldehyde dehydrogenase
MAGCADQVKRVTLELGGKSANIIFADSDIEKAAAAAPGAVFDNAGQDCCARSRLLVEKSVFDKFMAAFEKSVKNFKVADPSLANTDMGPLISSCCLYWICAKWKRFLDGTYSLITKGYKG